MPVAMLRAALAVTDTVAVNVIDCWTMTSAKICAEGQILRRLINYGLLRPIVR